MIVRRFLHLMIIAAMCILWLTACDTDNDDDALPTLAAMPESTSEAVVNAIPAGTTPEAESGRATLPATFTPTDTPTLTPTISATFTVTVTPSATITDTPTPTATPLPTIAPEERPLLAFVQTAGAFTPIPEGVNVPNMQGTQFAAPVSATPFLTPTMTLPGPGVPPTLPPPVTPVTLPTVPPVASTSTTACDFFPPGGFGTIYTSNPDIARQLGCPDGNPPDVLSIATAVQSFQNGLMIWLDGDIYVLYDETDAYQYYADTFDAASDPDVSGESPPAGLLAPVRGFLKVWANNPAVRAGLGWAETAEQGTQATVLRFVNGMMIWLPVRSDVLVLIGPPQGSGSWRSVTGSF